MTESLEEVKQDLNPDINLGDSRFLFLDLSSNCTGYAISSIDFLNRKARIVKAGCLWFDSHWEHAKKYHYIYTCLLNYFDVVEQIDYIIVEQYSINPTKMSGCLVSPELHGAVKTAAFENGIKVVSMLPQSWRKELGIKPNGIVGKRDYKGPTKEKVLTFCDVPDTVVSNITGSNRATPSDVYDAIALCAGWLTKHNLKYTADTCEFNSHIGAEQ